MRVFISFYKVCDCNMVSFDLLNYELICDCNMVSDQLF